MMKEAHGRFVWWLSNVPVSIQKGLEVWAPGNPEVSAHLEYQCKRPVEEYERDMCLKIILILELIRDWEGF